jgi:hypothetical protein
MGKTTGFLEYSRELAPRRPVTQRVNDWFEIYLDLPEETLKKQGARCMDCGVPFLSDGLSGQQFDSRLERSGVSRAVEGSGAAVARDQQLSGIYRPDLSGAL